MLDIEIILINVGVLVPVMIGLAKVAQKLGLPKKITPVFNLLVGVICGAVYIYPQDVKLAILAGVIAGLSASGLYSGVKNTVEEFSDIRED